MSAKKIKSILFYLIPLGLVMAYIFTTCYGVELDVLDDRITKVEEQLAEIQALIDKGMVVTSVVESPEGYVITFSDAKGNTVMTKEVKHGKDGAAGKDGTEWVILDSMWYNATPPGSPTSYRAIARDGERGADAKAPTVSDDGYWTFYEWNSVKGAYDTTTSKMMADTLLMYIVDFSDYYELYTPIQEKDAFGNPVMITDPVTGRQKVKRTWDHIKLPKWKPDPEPTLFFKFIGYAKVLPGDSVVELLTEDLNLQYTWMDFVRHGTTQITEDSLMWKWKRRGTGELVEDQFHIARLVGSDSLAVIFSINKSREYMNLLGDPSSSRSDFQLRNSRNEPLTAVRLDRPKFFDDKGLITKVGSNNDTLYVARMRNDPWLTTVPAMEFGKNIYYRIVINDTVRSELSPYPLRIATPWPLSVATVSNLIPSKVATVSWDQANSRYDIPNDTSVRYQLGFNSYSGNLFDHYITSSKPADSIRLYPLTPLINDTIIKVFKVDTLLQNPGDFYDFDIIVNKLQKDGAIYQETIKVRAIE
ncbi:MAG: DUF4988 domain-containing protein [Tannerellaceae bacterium]|jgi:hypothetical protein|nr:DUF4988 domain-containing protein [Tannerellaceae bacterium]